MAIYIPPNQGRVEGRRGRRDRKLPPIRTPRSIEKDIAHELTGLSNQMTLDVSRYASLLTLGPDEAFSTLNGLLDVWRRQIAVKSKLISHAWAQEISDYTKRAIEKNIASAMGLDMIAIIDGGGFAESVALASTEASQLITSIPGEYIDEVGKAVLQNFRGEPLPGGYKNLNEYLQSLEGVTRRKAELLARDQTSKMNSVFNQERMLDSGIDEYVWVTAQDRRVVGTPGGAYPKPTDMHGNHYERHNEIFRWDSPPHDGHPGWAINCRCTARAILDRDRINIIR